MTIKLHHLRPAAGSKSTKIRVGRGEGGKRGKTAGRGTKGTGARKNVPARFEGGQMPLHMRLPKLKGFTNRNRVVFQVVNLRDIERLFPEGGQIGIPELIAKGAVRKNEPRQGSRRRKPHREGRYLGQQVHGLRQGKDRRCRRFCNRGMSIASMC